jgi:hypothetical protein
MYLRCKHFEDTALIFQLLKKIHMFVGYICTRAESALTTVSGLGYVLISQNKGT